VEICVLELPERTRVICVYLEVEFLLPDSDSHLEVDDEIVLITRGGN